MMRPLVISVLVIALSPMLTFSKPNISSNKFVNGIYTDGDGSTCVLETSKLKNGRTEGILSCLKKGKIFLSATFITGKIKDHPFEADLKAAGIDNSRNIDGFSWGKTNESNAWQCFGNNHILSVQQRDNTLFVNNYKNDATASCGIGLAKKRSGQ
jgi:hypothetical protein